VSHSQFIKERQYLANVSPATIEWYTQSLHWLGTECPTSADLKNFVLRMRERGLKATACNNRIRAVNAYLKWSGSPLRVPKLKEPEFVLP
jgi:integrase/recombinase XerD